MGRVETAKRWFSGFEELGDFFVSEFSDCRWYLGWGYKFGFFLG